MDAPIESLPEVARERLETIQKRMHDEPRDHTLLEKFWLGVGGAFLPWVLEKGMEEAEGFVVEFFERDQAWIDNASKILYEEAEKTSRAAMETQLKSAFGKELPGDFAFNQNQLAAMRIRARESAESIARTYNAQIPKWIKQVKAEWNEKHGSLKGLNRWHIINGVSEKQRQFQGWKEGQIATSEFSAQWADATQDFWQANEGDLELEFLLSPSSASDPERDTEPICMEYINRWLTKDEAYMFPAHINCIHFISETRVKSGQTPVTVQIGNSLYMTEDL